MTDTADRITAQEIMHLLLAVEDLLDDIAAAAGLDEKVSCATRYTDFGELLGHMEGPDATRLAALGCLDNARALVGAAANSMLEAGEDNQLTAAITRKRLIAGGHGAAAASKLNECHAAMANGEWAKALTYARQTRDAAAAGLKEIKGQSE